MFTTRDAEIVAAAGAAEHVAGLRSPGEARTLLARWAGCAEETLSAEADELVGECGRLPLAISMAGAMLWGKPPAYWRHVLRLFRRADLSHIRGSFRFTRMRICCGRSRSAWMRWPTAERFVSLSLAQRVGEGGDLRLHDLQLDYARACYPDAGALELIHGALRLSSHVIERDPGQFASQVVGRLLPHGDTSGVGRFAAAVAKAAPRPWIGPLHPYHILPGWNFCARWKGILKGSPVWR